MTRLITLILAAFLLAQCKAPKSATVPAIATPGDQRIAFYNVENLFDTVDDPKNMGDDEYLPTSKKKFTPERYQTKLDHLAKVVKGMGYPALIGLAEVENAAVLKDFCEKTSLQAHGYGYVHFESPDFRGIDVALLYKKSRFSVAEAEAVRIQFPVGMIPDKPDYTTRDLLVVEGKFGGTVLLHLIVAHLPSRSDGQKETEPRRQHVAAQIAKQTAAILQKNKAANIVIMGDMNDEPTDPSMSQSLGAQALGTSLADGKLYNCFSQLHAEGKGSYRFRGDWNMLDQIILSTPLMDEKSPVHYQRSVIYQAEYMMYMDEKYGLSPSRTYGGDRYFGGYSDHLPIYVELGN
ncbi:MAG: endonuclease [Saprospiraceae bacterium]|jgi:predicted extracellular nuclease|nr:endonuclease [Saprospiraceae bacterium]